MSGSVIPPLIMTAAGPVPTPPATLNAAVIAQATALAPGLTVLPAGLIEDLSSTATGALVVIDQCRVDLIASVSPYSANPYIQNQLGQVYGVPKGLNTNTGVFVVFFGTGIIGYVVQAGFIVSDGTYQYSVQNAGIIGGEGSTQPLLAIAFQTGSWAIPSDTVTQLVTSVPTAISNPATGDGLTVSNPQQGTPSPGPQSEEDYRAQVLSAGLATVTGAPTTLKKALGNIAGVVSTLISVQQKSTPSVPNGVATQGWEIIVGGTGDPYQIAFAIYSAVPDIASLVGSVIRVTGITNANPGVVTTDLNHGYLSGQVVSIIEMQGMPALNGAFLTITVIDQTSFSIGLDTTTLGTYTGGGIALPNFRNQIINVYDYPDIYSVPYVVPPSQTVTMTVTWNTSPATGQTSSIGFVSNATIANAAQPALVAYVNTLPVGQPMNLFELNATFQNAVAPIVPLALLTRLVFAVSINGIGVAPQTGTGIIAGDPESYFVVTAAGVIISQG